MAKISCLYDAMVKTKVREDQCTNFLIYIIEKFPKDILDEIMKVSGLVYDSIDDYRSVQSQFLLEQSRPDALINFSENNYLILETKLYPNHYDPTQFGKHLHGGVKVFGKNHSWFLFLSGDTNCPSQLKPLLDKYHGKIGFLSWKVLIEIISNKYNYIDYPNKLVLKEFLLFAKRNNLGKYIHMNNIEIDKFIDNYYFVTTGKDFVEDHFNKVINNICDKIILESDQKVESYLDDVCNELPCIYRAFKIKGWHTKESAYLFINIVSKTIGIVLTGFQVEYDYPRFNKLWEEKYKNLFKSNSKLISFTWVDENEADYSLQNGYFKKIEGTSGKLFNPKQINEIGNFYYWGYEYPLHVDSLTDELFNTISTDFVMLIEYFSE